MWPLLLLAAGLAVMTRKGTPPVWTVSEWANPGTDLLAVGTRVSLRLAHANGSEESHVEGLVVGTPSNPLAGYTLLLSEKNPPPNPAGFEVGHFVEAARAQLKVLS